MSSNIRPPHGIHHSSHRSYHHSDPLQVSSPGSLYRRLLILAHPERESALALHANTLLGGPIPAAQANIAILAQFLNRFATGSPSDRPWVQLVMGEASSSSTPSLVTMALQANASALCANDLQEPEIRRHATRLYLSAIRRVQLALKSSQWQDPVVMYTCMILTLFEVCFAAMLVVRLLNLTALPDDSIQGSIC